MLEKEGRKAPQPKHRQGCRWAAPNKTPPHFYIKLLELLLNELGVAVWPDTDCECDVLSFSRRALIREVSAYSQVDFATELIWKQQFRTSAHVRWQATH